MKKETIKTALIGAVVGAIVAGGTSTVIAYSVNSNNVNFRPTDSAWKVNSVAEAIDDLYIKKTGNNYSTEERVVGTWVDGKPIYQKTITGLNINLTWTGQYQTHAKISPLIDNTDSIIGCYSYSDNKDLIYVNLVRYSDSGEWELVAAGTFNTDVSHTMTTLTIQYTKTTDTVENNNQG